MAEHMRTNDKSGAADARPTMASCKKERYDTSWYSSTTRKKSFDGAFLAVSTHRGSGARSWRMPSEIGMANERPSDPHYLRPSPLRGGVMCGVTTGSARACPGLSYGGTREQPPSDKTTGRTWRHDRVLIAEGPASQSACPQRAKLYGLSLIHISEPTRPY